MVLIVTMNLDMDMDMDMVLTQSLFSWEVLLVNLLLLLEKLEGYSKMLSIWEIFYSLFVSVFFGTCISTLNFLCIFFFLNYIILLSIW